MRTAPRRPSDSTTRLLLAAAATLGVGAAATRGQSAGPFTLTVLQNNDATPSDSITRTTVVEPVAAFVAGLGAFALLPRRRRN